MYPRPDNLPHIYQSVNPLVISPGATKVRVQVDVTGPSMNTTGQYTISSTVPADWQIDPASPTAFCSSIFGTCELHSVGGPTITGNSIGATLTSNSYNALSVTFTLIYIATMDQPASNGDTWDFSASGTWNRTATDPIQSNVTTPVTVTYLVGAVDVTVATNDASPLPDETELCFDGVCQPIASGTASGSVISLSNLPSGSFTISLRAPRYATASSTVTVEAGSTTQAVLTLVPLPGTAEITLTTSDGNPIPTGATVCLDDRCELADDILASAIDSGSTVVFDNVIPGSYPLSVTNTAPYLDATGSVIVPPGGTGQAAILLVLPAPTVTPTASATATSTTTPSPTASSTSTFTPTATATLAPDRGTIPPRLATATPTVTATSTAAPSGGSEHITQLPSTGTGESGDHTTWLALALGVLLLCLSWFGAFWNRRVIR